MRFQTEVGERERHRIEFRLDRFWVDVTICLDGIRIVRDLRLLAWRPIKRYRFDVGQEERHEVVLGAYRARKQEQVHHPVLNMRLRWGLVAHAQARILARHLRGDMDSYVPFVPRS